MAQIDTGLGWTAKDEWLMSVPGEVARIETIGGSAYPGQPIPKNLQTINDIVAAGFKILDYTQQYFGSIWYVASPDSSSILVAGEPISAGSGNYRNYTFWFISPTSCTIYIAQKGTGRYGNDRLQQIQINTLDSQTGLYFGIITGNANPVSPPDDNIHVYCPTFPDSRTALDSVVVANETFTKANAGYSVACVCKWKTPNNTILESPILISTDTNFVDMQTTVTGINLAKLNVLYQGRKFYMGFYDRPYTGTLETGLPVIDRSYSDAPTFTLEQLFKYIAGEVYANIQVTNAPDPYQEGEGSGEGGGDGEDDESDEIPFTDAPVSGIAYSGFLTIFTPNLSQLQSLANYMWSDFFDVDTWKKLFANPMDAILGLHIIPCSPGYSGNKEVKVGGKGTGVSMDYTTIRYHEVSMGTCNVPKKWGSYLDYNPYTKVSIFLPYIGFRDLDTDDVMDRTLALQYIVDILTGACVAELRCGTDVLYSWEGNCANPVPITSNSWSSAIGSAVSIAAAIATTALTHGASAPMIAGTVASVGANSMNLKPSVSRSGSLGGSGGFIAKQTPYIIRTVPNLVIPADQNKFIGYPSFVTTSLGSLTGYNEISSIHLEGIPATGNELTEIETLLKGGVIF